MYSLQSKRDADLLAVDFDYTHAPLTGMMSQL
jgi:hypothetical protein